MSMGTIVQVIGAVVDVQFPRDAIPKVYDALKLDDRNLTLAIFVRISLPLATLDPL